jgi:GT2 family glycosyltransferase
MAEAKSSDAPVIGDGSRTRAAAPVRASGKWLYAGEERLLLRGVTYGTFAACGGEPFPSPERVSEDFAQMIASGVNAVRTYTVPPAWLLDLAHGAGLRVMVGLPWEQHVAFLDEPGAAASIEARVRAGVRRVAGHPAVLCYAVGNEIPTSIVRWHGARRTERFLERLCRAVRDVDPSALVTYVNYPSTEYLHLPFLDFVCFNVFLEEETPFEQYVARLQNLAGDRPLVLTEIGLDSARNGEAEQARVLHRQLRTAYGVGAAGAFVFSWTDEWHRGGHDVDDWDFGLVDRDRQEKPALSSVQGVFADPVGPPPSGWPLASVVVCSFNGERWMRGCLEALSGLDYSRYEVIVVDDGSTDRTATVAAEFDWVRVISTENGGLSRARNVGLKAARGEVVVYLDDDARPEPSWLSHLVRALMTGTHVAVGGPNIAPPDDGLAADCVANAPGGPTHVLLSDGEAEHIPGCNMAFRAETLRAIGGFDPTFRIAGDDVDVCWRLQERGETIGFAPSAMVWHHRRPSLRGFLRQQFQYGKAEALLERKWPERYNRRGHVTWAGRVYGNSLAVTMNRRRNRIQYGTWGQALFQTRQVAPPGFVSSLARTPEWFLVLAGLAGLAALGALWAPLLAALAALGAGAGVTVLEAWRAAAHAKFTHEPRSRGLERRMRLITAGLHLLQPVARLAGRLRHGLAPWRRCCPRNLALPLPRADVIWSEHWRAASDRLVHLESTMSEARPRRGGEYERWDLEVRGGLLATARVRMTLEEHGEGRQLARLRSWPVPVPAAVTLCALLAALGVLAFMDGASLVGMLMTLMAAGLGGWCLLDCATAVGALRAGIRRGVESDSAEVSMTAGPGITAARTSTTSGSEAANPLKVPAAASAPDARGALAHAIQADERGHVQ